MESGFEEVGGSEAIEGLGDRGGDGSEGVGVAPEGEGEANGVFK